MGDNNSFLENEDSGQQVEQLAKYGAKKAGKGILSWLAGLLGVGVGTLILYIAIALFVILLFFFIIYAVASFFTPAMGMDYGARKKFAEDNSVSVNDIDEAAFQRCYYDPENVKKDLDAIFNNLSETKDGYLYITKDNFISILDYLIAYNKAVRECDNQYSIYHHWLSYSSEVVQEKAGGGSTVDGNDITPAGDNVNTLGIKDEKRGEGGRERNIDADGTDANGNPVEGYTVWSYEDVETTEERPLQKIHNKSIEDDPYLKVSWEEVFTFAAMLSEIQQGYHENWETRTTLNEIQDPEVKALSRLSEETIVAMLNEFEYTVGYYFDPTSNETMPGSSDTYATHEYMYDEMENFAYMEKKWGDGEEVEHGTEVYKPADNYTPEFDRYKAKVPSVAPAEASNAYCKIIYIYEALPDGRKQCTTRQIDYDGEAFVEAMNGLLGTRDFDFEWFIRFIEKLPGSKYTESGSDIGEAVAQSAKSKVGCAYDQNRRDQEGVYDCSSLVYRTYSEFGVSLPTIAAEQGKYCYENNLIISQSELKPGDLIFYSHEQNGRFRDISHVAIYVGNGMMVHASNPRRGVVLDPLATKDLVFCGRPTGGTSGIGSIYDRFLKLKESYDTGQIVTEYDDSDFIGKGVIIGTGLDMGRVQMTRIEMRKREGETDPQPDYVDVDTPPLSLNREEFVKAVAEYAVRVYQQEGILPSLVIAQVMLESSWGESGLARKAFNFTGMKAGGGWTGDTILMWTHDGAHGEIYRQQYFRKYANFDAGMAGHYEFYHYNRYRNLVGVTDYERAADLVKADGWAEDENYAAKLKSMIRKHGWTKYDQIAISGGSL